MPYVAAIGHRVALQNLLDKFGFEDLDEAEITLDEAGITLFTNNTDDVFVTITGKHKIIDKDTYVDLNFTLTPDEEIILSTYTGQNNKRIKLFWIESQEEDPINMVSQMFQKIGEAFSSEEEDEYEYEETFSSEEGDFSTKSRKIKLSNL